MNTLDRMLEHLGTLVFKGNSPMDLENAAKSLLNIYKVEAVFPGQTHSPQAPPYENILCVSVNNEVIHGIPTTRKFEDGDVVSIDCGIKEDGLIYDGAITILCGPKDEQGRILGTSAVARKLVKVTQQALEAGIAAAKAGSTNFAITEAIEKVAKDNDLQVVEGFGGHGVGTTLHEPPFIANRAADLKGEPFQLTAGMRIAIEPMFCTASAKTYVEANGWTIKVKSGLAAHFEKTITVA